MLNVDTKILSKAISNKLKTVLPTLISSQQTAYVKNRFIGESGRLISDIIEIRGCFNITGFLVTMNIRKAFDSLDHRFISILKKFDFRKNFITWIEMLLKDQQSCVINGRTTSQYFKLERGACQDDPVSAYLFILVLEILFLFIKKHPEIKGIELFEYCFLYTAYADDTTFFLKDAYYIENLVEIFNTFSLFSGLKPNLTKCKIAGIRALKGGSNDNLWYEVH